MQSDSGSELSPAEAADELSRLGQEMDLWPQEPPAKSASVRMADFKEAARLALLGTEEVDSTPGSLTTEEQDRIADGEPYCFRCGKSASSFEIYEQLYDAGSGATAAEWVREQEGTYNPATNRFACDACYIAIGMPVGPLSVGWKAP